MNAALAVVRRDAIVAMSYPLSFWMPWVSIVISVVGFAYVSKLVTPSQTLGVHGNTATYFTYVIVNVAFTVLLSGALQSSANVIRRDQLTGTLESILVSATPVHVIAYSSGLWSLAISVLQLLFYLGLGSIFGLELPRANVVALCVFLCLSVTSMMSLGLMASAVVIACKQAPPSGMLVGSAASLLAGVLFPVALLPEPLRIVSWFLPLTHALAGIRGAMSGSNLAELAGDAVWLAVATAILIPVALLLLRCLIEHAKQDATLAFY
jgi:ABC-2 type transport system permease protein